MDAEHIGLVAAFLTTVSFVPQAVHIVRTGQTEGISLIMYSLFTTGIAIWFIYGLMISSLPVYLCNGITLVLAATILTLKTRAVLQARSQAISAAKAA